MVPILTIFDDHKLRVANVRIRLRELTFGQKVESFLRLDSPIFYFPTESVLP